MNNYIPGDQIIVKHQVGGVNIQSTLHRDCLYTVRSVAGDYVGLVEVTHRPFHYSIFATPVAVHLPFYKKHPTMPKSVKREPKMFDMFKEAWCIRCEFNDKQNTRYLYDWILTQGFEDTDGAMLSDLEKAMDYGAKKTCLFFSAADTTSWDFTYDLEGRYSKAAEIVVKPIVREVEYEVVYPTDRRFQELEEQIQELQEQLRSLTR